jgi:RNA polymerase sigma-70 factor (ECF subfamily)
MNDKVVAAVFADDLDLVQRALARDACSFRTIMKKHNRRLYQIARGMIGNDGEAEDIVLEAYLRAFTHLAGFRGQSSLATWLTRIVINETLSRLRKRKRRGKTIVPMGSTDEVRAIRFPFNASHDDPERTTAGRQTLLLVERVIADLPDIYRKVFVARVIDGMDIVETAERLGIRPEIVKTRLHRARTLVRQALGEHTNTLPFRVVTQTFLH